MKSDYERVNDLQMWKHRFLLCSMVITIILSLNDKYKWVATGSTLVDYMTLLVAINTLLVLLYLVIELRSNYLFTKAEKLRRLQYLDNSFGTSFAGIGQTGYFSQDQLTLGFYKLTVNCFENSFHTYNILKRMQVSIYRNAIIVAIIFVFSAIIGDKGTVRTIIEAILPMVLVQEAVKLVILIGRLENLLDSFRSLFNSMRGSTFLNREPEAMKQVIDYETTLGWASMPLDSDIFFELQDGLANEWEQLKQLYQIETT